MAKKRKPPTKCDKFWRMCTSWDMFGEQVKFNLDGKESFDTCCGSLCTLLILLTITVYFFFQMRYYNNQETQIPILAYYNKKGYYKDPVEIRQSENNFHFAVAITGK